MAYFKVSHDFAGLLKGGTCRLPQSLVRHANFPASCWQERPKEDPGNL